MSDYQAFRVELADKIARVTINRPDKRNAMNSDFWTEIIDIFRWVDRTDEVRVVVLTGAGEHFSSGIDLNLLAQVAGMMGKDVGRNAEALRRKIRELQASFTAVDQCRKPVLAAIQGYCLGGAIDLIAACDMRYATQDAQFSIKEIDMGMAGRCRYLATPAAHHRRRHDARAGLYRARHQRRPRRSASAWSTAPGTASRNCSTACCASRPRLPPSRRSPFAAPRK